MSDDPERLHQAIGRVVGGADVDHLAGAHRVVERAQQLFFGRAQVLHVDLIQIDAVGAEALEAVVDGACDAHARGSGAVGPGRHAEASLGRDDHLLARAARGEPLAEDALGQAVLAVDIGGIDEVDAGRERAIEHTEAFLAVGADLVHERLGVGLAEGHAAEAEHRDLRAGLTELTVAHAANSTPRPRHEAARTFYARSSPS